MLDLLNNDYRLESLLRNKFVLKVIKFGSVIYGTQSELSDTDYLVITGFDEYEKDYKDNNNDIHIIGIDTWEEMRDYHSINFIEAYFSDNVYWIKGEKDHIENNLEINYDLIRAEFSKIASNSWVKCKKKLTVEKDYNPYIAKKSLFHSLRILMFGIQIMKFEKIVDFSEANIYYDEVMNCDNDWWYIKNKFQPIYNKLKSDFRYYHSKRMEIIQTN